MLATMTVLAFPPMESCITTKPAASRGQLTALQPADAGVMAALAMIRSCVWRMAMRQIYYCCLAPYLQ